MENRAVMVKHIGRRRKKAKVDIAEEVQVRKVEISRLSGQVDREKKQKVENEKAFTKKKGTGKQQN